MAEKNKAYEPKYNRIIAKGVTGIYKDKTIEVQIGLDNYLSFRNEDNIPYSIGYIGVEAPDWEIVEETKTLDSKAYLPNHALERNESVFKITDIKQFIKDIKEEIQKKELMPSEAEEKVDEIINKKAGKRLI